MNTMTAKLIPFDSRLKAEPAQGPPIDPQVRQGATIALDMLLQLATMPPDQQPTAINLLRQFGSLPRDVMTVLLEHLDEIDETPTDAACSCTFRNDDDNLTAGFTPLGGGQWRCEACAGLLTTAQLPDDFQCAA
ncbi:MAG TPA: hypothetical protein VM165_10675, partial [Planctomycetaceae bacterium]|nr:hypothetical protein [Planctomycetaceae bacterium]